MDLLLVAAGLVALVGGGDIMLRGAVRVAEALSVPPLVIGLTLVAFGTSVPELATSLVAMQDNAPAIAIGNVVGSNICNILLILGLAALIRPVIIDRRALGRDGAVLALATALASLLLVTGWFTVATTVIFLGLLAAWTLLTFWTERRRGTESDLEVVATPGGGLLLSLALAIGGIAIVILGATWLVDGAVGIARGLGIPEAVIGVTLVAVGTSLPEMVASVMASLRGQNGIAFGNVVGSNIFNVFAILGATSLYGAVPPEVLEAFLAVDIWVLIASAAALLVVAATGCRITRGEGALLLGGYGIYLSFVFLLP